MSGERNKLLWIAVSVCLFVLVATAAGLYLFAPEKGGAEAPASLGNAAAPKAADPQDFLMLPPPPPPEEKPRSDVGDIIVIYGEKPTGLELPSAGGTTGGAAKTAAASEAAPGPIGARTAQAVAAPKAAATTVAVPAAKVATSTKAAAPAKTATSAKVKTEEYWIQAASFTSRGRADEMKESLASKGVASLISVKDIDGKSWYRVRVGPYRSKGEAEGWLSQLKQMQGCSEAWVSKSTVER
jgi:DedD protein